MHRINGLNRHVKCIPLGPHIEFIVFVVSILNIYYLVTMLKRLPRRRVEGSILWAPDGFPC